MKILKLFFLAALLISASCSMFTKKGSWGKDALWPVKGERIANAIKKNMENPHVWLPLGFAGVTYFGNYDQKISDWAVEYKPIYTTKDNTSFWSDRFNNILLYEMYLSILLTTSMDEDKSLTQYAISKGKGALVVNMASRGAKISRDQLAKSFKRQRPNGEDHLSFPSGHSTDAGIRNTLVSKNLDSTPMHNFLRIGIKTINTTMASGTLWARLEGQRHYPSDILSGYALGTFLSGVVYDSLMNLDASESVAIVPLKDQVSVRYALQF